jgi:dephospho-CoA kinase
VLILGLTGSIGMGKSTVAQRLKVLGIPVCDADAVVHELYSGAAVDAVGRAFPGVVQNGRIDRARLGAQLLQNPAGFKVLERIVHPLVRAAEREFLKSCHDNGDKISVLEIPLLFETSGDKLVDVTMVVSAPSAMQRDRVLSRPGMSEKKFEEILSRQMTDEEKRARADFVVDTSGSIANTWSQFDSVFATMSGRDGHAFVSHWQD